MLIRNLSGVLLVASVVAASTQFSPALAVSSSLNVHEWGTFTTVAGPDGRATDWYPLDGPSDLPCFVDRFRNGAVSVQVPPSPAAPSPATDLSGFEGKVAGVVIARGINPNGLGAPVAQSAPTAAERYDYEATRANVRAKVRMETPVLYFYSPDQVSADVRVRFPRGLMTEWYPNATVTQDDIGTRTLSDPTQTGVIEWKNVVVTPLAKPNFLNASAPSHYFAARATDAVPLSVDGQSEKFLFYRGVANFDVPIAAALDDQGRVAVRNLATQPLPVAILFENHDGNIGFRVQSAGIPAAGTLSMEPPALTTDFDALRVELEHTLTNAGLYPREAAAMVNTWRDSWFEEGTRVFYLFPQKTIDAILPLDIQPAPSQTVRVFVGRMEIITPALEEKVARAVGAHDSTALAPIARFFGPIADRIMAQPGNASRRPEFDQMANILLTSYVKRMTTCEQ